MLKEQKIEKTLYEGEPGDPKAADDGFHARRESALGVLNRKENTFVAKLDAIKVLKKVIPWDLLTEEQDQLLWRHFIDWDR